MPSITNLIDSDDLLPLHYLNDFLFCERRAALHLLEGIWRDNKYTVEGSFAHRNVDVEGNRKRGSKQNVTGLWVVSYRLGIIGKCDLVEFPVGQDCNLASCYLGQVGNLAYNGVPYPVDFKRGKKRRWDNNEVQLCAQALCLEEMLGLSVPLGAIFHILSGRREEIEFTPELRHKTETTVQQLRSLLNLKTTPKAKFAPKCKGCSLLEWCLPKSLRPRATAAAYIASIVDDS